ncbi:hypothetical protein BBBOND_0311790 [Babesia bigemina]|uniref:Uncharacterized protein n=1 Tax=Babesia bigemina TaxID=5866 RepID=A0A061D9B1_BABBI|nr:hypothetical protein BBBOND_0311790 [Babesia bigemina]CDR97276.1 hypothetical protein BBBOND_0311790 [Babesia bigemina]|eukprot:XP_012769462.1 hypothetical protein BBBOND_0311790 [Babesia bigemina]
MSATQAVHFAGEAIADLVEGPNAKDAHDANGEEDDEENEDDDIRDGGDSNEIIYHWIEPKKRKQSVHREHGYCSRQEICLSFYLYNMGTDIYIWNYYTFYIGSHIPKERNRNCGSHFCALRRLLPHSKHFFCAIFYSTYRTMNLLPQPGTLTVSHRRHCSSQMNAIQITADYITTMKLSQLR